MMFRTHLALGFLVGLLSLKILDTNHPVLFVFLVTLFSSLPDIDHPKSKIGRKLFFISWPISLVFKHRGFFHSIFPPLILFFVFNSLNISFLAFSIALGYISHLIGDSLTKEGINFLHPISTFKIKGIISTGKLLETMIFLLIIVLDIILLFGITYN